MKKSVLLWVFKKIKKQIPLLILTTVLYIAVAYLGVQLALETKGVLEVVQHNMQPGNAARSVWDAFLSTAFFERAIRLMAVVLTTFIVRFFSRFTQEKLSIEIERNLRSEYLHRLLRGRFADVKKYHSGDLVNRLSTDVRTVEQGAVNVIPGLMQMLTRLVAAAVVLFTLEPYMTLVILGLGLLIALVTAGLRRRLKGLHKAESESNGKVNSFVQEALEKLLIVRAMDMQDEMERRGDAVLSDRVRVRNKQKNMRILGNMGLSVAMNLVYYGALLYMAVRLMQGAITFGTLTAVTQLVGQVEGPLANMSSVIHQYIAMIGSAERLMELERIPAEEQATEDAAALYEKMQRISADRISFTYPDDPEQVITDRSFTIEKNSFTVVTGESGAGKSTLLKLILGIFKVDDGTLSVETAEGPVPVTRAVGNLFSYVPQGNFLISGTLRDNILLAKPDATDAEIQKALYVSDLETFTAELPNGLNTELSESGVGISEGQAQRLSIARAVLRNAPILLLDEATSALDETTEMTVLKRIREIPEKTIIAVTHRPAAKTLADREIIF